MITESDIRALVLLILLNSLRKRDKNALHMLVLLYPHQIIFLWNAKQHHISLLVRAQPGIYSFHGSKVNLTEWLPFQVYDFYLTVAFNPNNNQS